MALQRSQKTWPHLVTRRAPPCAMQALQCSQSSCFWSAPPPPPLALLLGPADEVAIAAGCIVLPLHRFHSEYSIIRTNIFLSGNKGKAQGGYEKVWKVRQRIAKWLVFSWLYRLSELIVLVSGGVVTVWGEIMLVRNKEENLQRVSDFVY